MFGKTIVSLIVFLIVIIITYSIRIGSLDFRSQFSFLTQCPPPNDRRRSNPPSNTTEPSSVPLKVYMYDLPIRFNVGMLNPHQSGGKDEPLTARNLPPWPRNSGMRTQHSVEYWMTASLLYEGNETREAVRVLDPGAADVFFVPFFSSLSFGVHGRKMKDPETEIDRKLQVDILDFLRNSSYWQKSSGRDHVIPMHHPNAFRFLKKEVNASILIVSDFGRYSKIMANLSKDVVAPYVHFVDSFVDDNLRDPYESRTMLLFFRGGIKRKDEGIVRHKLEKVFEGYDDVHYEQSSATAESINASAKGMRKSKFCLHPAGDTPSSCRLFDAIVSHCVPVIVSDHIELPFEDELDYTQFSVFFSVKEALVPGYMVKQLRQFRKERWLKMWCRLKEISRHYEYQYPPKKEDAVDMIWREVKHKVPAAKLAVHRSRRLKVPDWW